MKAKEKAEELIKKYEKTLDRELLPINDKDCFHSAKRCALIAVDEVISVLSCERLTQSPYTTYEERKFYIQVKKEIEKL
jgi:hypothetical protein